MSVNKTKRVLIYCEKYFPQYYSDGEWKFFIESVEKENYIVQFNSLDSAKDWFNSKKYFIYKTKDHYHKKYVKTIDID